MRLIMKDLWLNLSTFTSKERSFRCGDSRSKAQEMRVNVVCGVKELFLRWVSLYWLID